jgi:farnesyl diphosphate synthase
MLPVEVVVAPLILIATPAFHIESASSRVKVLKKYHPINWTTKMPKLTRSLFSLRGHILDPLEDMFKFAARLVPTRREIARAKAEKLITKETKLNDSYDLVLSSLTGDQHMNSKLKTAVDHFVFAMNENAKGGKMIRGNTVINTLLSIRPKATSSDLVSAHGVAWSLETLQGSFVIADDIMDKSETRRNKLCWYLRPEVGILATNDVLSLLTAGYEILDLFVSDRDCYPQVVRLINKLNRLTILGECMDIQFNSNPGQRPDLSSFTWENYKNILHHKTGFYTFVIPVQLGYTLAGIDDEEIFQKSERILLDFAVFYQIQDDYLDAFGDPEKSGKIGRDIEEGKLCWPILFALEKCSPAQKEFLVNNYGKDDPTVTAKVKKLYADLGIHEEYKKLEAKERDRLLQGVDKLCDEHPVIPHAVFKGIIDKLFGRNR